jgi:predicted acetyltransferase
LHLSFADVRDGSNNLIPSVYHECNTQGVGLMYRIINTRGFFKEAAGHNFNNQSCRLKIKVLDSLMPLNNESMVIDFQEGHPYLSEGCNFEVEICLDIAEFSSLVMGVVDFETLYEYGLAEISDSKYTEKVSNIFKTSKKPTCVTAF